MKVKVTTTGKISTFKELPVGDVFRITPDTHPFLKINQSECFDLVTNKNGNFLSVAKTTSYRDNVFVAKKADLSVEF